MLKLKTKYKNNVLAAIADYCKVNFRLLPKEKFKLGQGIYNLKCHMNTVQKVKEKNAEKVLLCVIMNSSDDPIVHFINMDKSGNYIDNTLGWEWEYYDYYLIKEINQDEFSYIGSVLLKTKKVILESCSNKILNTLFSVGPEII